MPQSPPRTTPPLPDAVLEGIVHRVVFHNPENGWTVLRLKTDKARVVTSVGRLPGVQAGERLRLEGSWQDDPKYGRQLRIEAFSSIEPSTREGLELYLGSGSLRGVGPATAKRLLDRFGKDVLRVLDEEPERLQEISGIGAVKLERIKSSWQKQRKTRDALIFLQQHGLSPALAARVIRKYADSAIAIAKHNPYRFAEDIGGVGFAVADRFAQALGLEQTSARRAEAGLLFSLRSAAARGHTFVPVEELVREATQLLEVDRETVRSGLPPAVERKAIILGRDSQGEQTAALASLAIAEQRIATRLSVLARTPADEAVASVDRALVWWQSRSRIELAPAQQRAVALALTEKVSVVTGGPGTGKTTLLKAILDILRTKRKRILLGAPTGRAANRLAEATGSEVKTVHRLLDFNPRSGKFRKNLDDPLEADLVVIDEASMLDVSLAQALFEAVPVEARLLLVGDADQLPSVGPGKVLDDIIDSARLPVVRLEEIFRQSSASKIVVNAHRIRAGKMPALDSDIESDFFFIERHSPDEVVPVLKNVVGRRIPKQFGLSPLRDIQVLAPMRRGPLGTQQLNIELQELLNPGPPVLGGFRLRDRVMQTRNNYDVDVFNGDIGTVVGTTGNNEGLIVRFESRDVEYQGGALEELVLAYACTVHKSQGSEYPCIVMPIHTQHFIMLRQNLLYTAVTRAQRLVVLIGQKRALEIAVSNRRREQRRTKLGANLHDEFESA